MRRKLRRHFAFLMAVLMMLSLMGFRYWQKVYKLRLYKPQRNRLYRAPGRNRCGRDFPIRNAETKCKRISPEWVVTEEGKSTDSEKISVALKDEILTKVL